jgi:hypothetical protein
MTNIKRSMLLAATVIVGSVLSLPLNGQQPSQRDTVRVLGRGATRWAARNDAVRQALQQRVRQLVIADRAIAGDSLLYDNTVSTLNGFVESFDVISERIEDKEVQLDTKIVVGTGEITRYIARRKTPTGAAIDGDGLLARVQATRLASEATARIVSRLFNGFPEFAVNLLIDDVQPDPSDREKAIVSGRVSIDEDFIRQFEDGLASLKQESCTDDCEFSYQKIGTASKSSETHFRRIDSGVICGDGPKLPHGYCVPSFLNGWPVRGSWFSDTNDGLRIALRNQDRVSITEASIIFDDENDDTSFCGSMDLYDIAVGEKDMGVCLTSGYRVFEAKVPLGFLEKARTIQGYVLPTELSNQCSAKDVVSTACRIGLARLLGSPRRQP